MEQLLISNGWNRQPNGDWQHRDGRALIRGDRGWLLAPRQGKPQKLAQTLKGAIVALKLGLDRKGVTND